MKRILVTSFKPFAGHELNSSYEVVNRIKDKLNDFEIVKENIDVIYEDKIFLELLQKHNPDVILHCGQAGGRKTVDLEYVAINLMHSKTPDNNNVIKSGEKIFSDGVDAYFSNLDVIGIVEELQKENLPVNLSLSAGAYICNLSFYSSLYYSKKNKMNTKVAFIHFPYYKGQLENDQFPSLELDKMVESLEKIIQKIKVEG